MNLRKAIINYLEHTFTFQDYVKLYPSFMDRIDIIVEHIPEDLREAIEQVVSTTTSSPDELACLQSSLELTKAEAQITLMLSEGRHLMDIAKKRGVSRNTVRNQLQNIYQKTQTNSLPALIHLANKTLKC